MVAKPEWTKFQTWLSHLHALEDLFISFEWPDPGDYGPYHDGDDDWDTMLSVPNWNRLATCLKDAPLSTLTIGMGRFSTAGILCLLASLTTRLSDFSMLSSTLVDDRKAWYKVFNWITENLHLSCAEFGDISIDGGEMVTKSGDDFFKLKGSPEAVKSMLSEQMRTIRFNHDDDSEVAGDEAAVTAGSETTGGD